MDHERRDAPATEEGWYALHDFRRIDWDAWGNAPERERERAIEEGLEYLKRHHAVEDAESGSTTAFSIVGHKADFMLLHLRPSLEHLDRAERRFESTALGAFTEQPTSYVSVTEASGYTHDISEGIDAIEDPGMRNYMRQRLYPTIPDAEYVCFYPMDKRRDPEQNWYDLPFDERADHMSSHGEIGREYAGAIVQMITGSIGLDDYEWGVTLFASDLVDVKDLLYEMRFDPSTSQFAEFGPFYVGRRFPPADLEALFAGETVPSDEPLDDDAREAGTEERESATEKRGGGGPPTDDASHAEIEPDAFGERIMDLGVEIQESDGYGLLFTSDADVETVDAEVDELADNFDHYDTHVRTTVVDADETAVVSLWANERAASIASGFLADLPGVEEGVGAPLASENDERNAPDSGSEPNSGDESSAGGPPGTDESTHEEVDAERIEQAARRFGIDLNAANAGYGLVFYSDADAEELQEDVDGLRGNFGHYDTHVQTSVRAESGETAVISLWANERAASVASGFLADLPGVTGGIGSPLDGDDATVDSQDADSSLSHGTDDEGGVREELEDLDIYAGRPHGEDVYAMVLYSEADPDNLSERLDALREEFDREDRHVKSAIYTTASADRSAIVSIWDSQDAAESAGDDLADLPGIVARAGDESHFGTMGMFYTVKPPHREDFVETFDEVGEALGEMDGHLETLLLGNVEDENDMFIASQWRDRDDAMEFFRSEAFRDTVEWGREILADRPRHVFLA
ncbi:MAG: heme-binding protein [Natronomonas sp.]